MKFTRGSISEAGQRVLLVLVAVLWAAGLHALGWYNFALFHVFAELFIFGVAASIFVVAWNSRPFAENGFFLNLGISALFSGAFHFFHMLIHYGGPFYQEPTTNLSMEFWLFSRFLLAGTLFLTPVFAGRKLRSPYVLAAYILLTSLFSLASYSGVLPRIVLETRELTPLGTAAEATVAVLFLLSAGHLYLRRRRFAPRFWKAALISALLAFAGELAFIPYGDQQTAVDMPGHVLVILSFYFLYRGVVLTALREPYALLFRELKQSEESYRNTAHDLAEANAELDHFVAVASHDLQEPLRMVSSYLQLVEKRYNDKLDDNGREFIGYAVDGASRMQALIQSLLSYARAKSRELRPIPVKSQNIVKRALLDLRPAMRDSDALVNVAPIPTVLGDEIQLTQLFLNLIGNAIKFRDPERRCVVEVDARQENDQWVFTVKDNGIGVEPAYQDKIFNAFQRGPGHGRIQGSGIGLATCKKIVERHGGRIWLQSQPGQGSTFFFTLPGA